MESLEQKEVLLKNFGWTKSKEHELYYKFCGRNEKPATISFLKVTEFTKKKLRLELERLEDDAKNFKNLTMGDYEKMELRLEQILRDNKPKL